MAGVARLFERANVASLARSISAVSDGEYAQYAITRIRSTRMTDAESQRRNNIGRFRFQTAVPTKATRVDRFFLETDAESTGIYRKEMRSSEELADNRRQSERKE